MKMKVYKSKRTGIEIAILNQYNDYIIYKVLSGMNIGFVGRMSETDLNNSWEATDGI